jgi:hypothetical protein
VEAAERQGGLRDPPPCVAEERREAGSRERSLGRCDRIERERERCGGRASVGGPGAQPGVETDVR